MRIMARRPPPQPPRHILKSSSRLPLLGRLDGALERFDLIFVRLEKVFDVDLAIGVRVASRYGGDDVLRPLLESGTFDRIARTRVAWRLLPLSRSIGHGGSGTGVAIASRLFELTGPTVAATESFSETVPTPTGLARSHSSRQHVSGRSTGSPYQRRLGPFGIGPNVPGQQRHSVSSARPLARLLINYSIHNIFISPFRPGAPPF